MSIELVEEDIKEQALDGTVDQNLATKVIEEDIEMTDDGRDETKFVNSAECSQLVTAETSEDTLIDNISPLPREDNSCDTTYNIVVEVATEQSLAAKIPSCHPDEENEEETSHENDEKETEQSHDVENETVMLSSSEVEVLQTVGNDLQENSRPKRNSKPPPKYKDHILPSRSEKSDISPSIDGAAVITDSDVVIDSGVLYCSCKQPWTKSDGDNMVFCENCCQWLHYVCAGVDKKKAKTVKKYICLQCAMFLFDNAEKSQAAVEDMKMQIEDKKKEVLQTTQSLDIMTKRCAALEKEKTSSAFRLTSLEASHKTEVENKEDLLKKITSLKLEIESHKQINKDIIEQASNVSSNGKKSPCEGCKEKNKEILSLKDRLCSTESMIKDYEKSTESTRSELYAAKLEVRREKAINNILMKFDESTHSSSGQVVELKIPPDHEANDTLKPSAAPTTGGASNEDSSLKKCRYEMKERGTCPYKSGQCKFSHETNIQLTSQPKEFCEIEFRGGRGSCPKKQNCNKSHEFDYQKLAKGICIYELKRKSNCKEEDQCLFSHQIPSMCRGDTQLAADLAEKLKKNKANRKNIPQANGIPVGEKDVCMNEFYGGPNSCKEANCRKDKNHDLDFKKARRGICLFEFFKKDSCIHKK